ncbi:MAG: hypothetical protein AAFU84_08750 [Cyanobacteria bacterium J06633_23]
MNINFSSLLENALASLEETISLDDAVSVSLLPTIDFDSLIADVTDVVNDVISDIDQVVEAVTSRVIETLGELDIESDAVDVSSIVDEVFNFIANLSDDATISDALNDIADSFAVTLPSLSEAELEDLLTDVSDLISDIAPDLSQLSITPLLDQGVEFLDELSDSIGTITIDGTSLSGDLTTGDVTRSFTTDVSGDINRLFEDASDFLSGITGSANLDNGQFLGNVTIDDTQYDFGLDITEALTDGITSLLSTADVTLPFSNGVIVVDINTFLGDIEGTIGFASGALDFDLLTPLGEIDTDVAFPDDAQFDVPVSFPALSEVELDFAAGLLRVPILNTVIDVPLEILSGEIGLTDSVATVALDEGLLGMPIESSFEIGPLASEVAVALTEDLTGELTLDAGEIEGSITTNFGDFALAASFDDLVLQANSLIDQTTGALTLANGLASIDLTTPLGELSGALALSAVDGVLSEASSLLA